MEISRIKKLAVLMGTIATLSLTSPAQETNYAAKVEEAIANYGPYQHLRKEGAILGILYNPSQSTLATIASNLFSQAQQRDSSFLGTNTLEAYVRDNVSGLSEVESTSVSIFPIPNVETWGKKIPCYIIFMKDFPNSFENKNKEDLKRVVGHEVNHVTDFYYGMKLDLPQNKGSSQNRKLLVALAEIRADYPIVRNMMQEHDKGKLKNSEQFMAKIMMHYLEHWQIINNIYPTANEYEKAVIESERKRTSEIISFKDVNGETIVTLGTNSTLKAK